MIEINTAEDFDVFVNPTKYGYKECPDCNGQGSEVSIEKGISLVIICDTCEGDGLIKDDTNKY